MLKGSAKIQFTVCNFAPIGMKIENNFVLYLHISKKITSI